jgi:hypothetical protein
VNGSLASGGSDEVFLRGQVLILGAITSFCVSVFVMSLNFYLEEKHPIASHIYIDCPL